MEGLTLLIDFTIKDQSGATLIDSKYSHSNLTPETISEAFQMWLTDVNGGLGYIAEAKKENPDKTIEVRFSREVKDD